MQVNKIWNPIMIKTLKTLGIELPQSDKGHLQKQNKNHSNHT